MIRVRTLALAVLLISSASSFAAPIGRPGATPLPDFPLHARGMSCKELNTLKLSGGKITNAEVVSSGVFNTPGPGSIALPFLPKFCRVQAQATPTRDSLIKFEVWIPLGAAYRHRYLQVGNGGFSGDIVYVALAEGIRRGYATASTDDGSQMHGSAAFVLGHPQKVIDYGYRALKETTDKSKFIIQAMMGGAPRFSYFHGCSNGGREALMEAQRYPDDFNGIVVGAPANYFTHQFADFVWNSQQMYPPGSTVGNISATPLQALTDGVLAQCAGHDGGLASDKFLTNPPACHVNFAPMTCAPGAPPGGACLTTTQVDIVRAIYDGAERDTAPHTQIYPGFEPGAEARPGNWGAWITGTGGSVGLQALFGWGFFGFFVHGDPTWDFHTMNFSSDIDNADALFAATLNSTEPNLQPFRSRGGKLIQYHGWDDAAVAPRNSINYWASVETKMKTVVPGFARADLDAFYRLFMVPGMSHCAGGPGATAFGNLFRGSAMDADHDVMLAMERWVEGGVAPERIVAKHHSEGPGDPAFERPLCVFPKLPKYNGSGSPSVASNWSCVAPRRFPITRYRIERDLPRFRPR